MLDNDIARDVKTDRPLVFKNPVRSMVAQASEKDIGEIKSSRLVDCNFDMPVLLSISQPLL